MVAWSADGTELWRKDVGPVLHVTGHPEGGVVVGIRGGDLHCFTGDGTKQWTFHTGDILTKPAFGPKNELYTGSRKTLYAITAEHATTEQRAAEAARVAEEETKTAVPAENATIQQDDGWVIIGSVRVPVRK